MRIEVKYKKEADIGRGAYQIRYSVAVDSQEPKRWKSFDPPLGGFGTRDFYDHVMSFVSGLTMGKSGMRLDEAKALAKDIIKRAMKNGRELHYVMQHRKSAKIVELKTGEGYTIWLRYNDGVSGWIDLSEHAGKPVFKPWEDREFFESVHINNKWHTVGWGKDPYSEDYIDLCPDNLYMEAAGLTYKQMFPEYYETLSDEEKAEIDKEDAERLSK